MNFVPPPPPETVYLVDRSNGARPLDLFFTPDALRVERLEHTGTHFEHPAGNRYYDLVKTQTQPADFEERFRQEYFLTLADLNILLPALHKLNRADPAIDQRAQLFEKAVGVLNAPDYPGARSYSPLPTRSRYWPEGRGAVVTQREIDHRYLYNHGLHIRRL